MVNLVIIGYGGMGGYHFGKLKSSDRIRVVGVYDIDPSRGELALSQGLKSYESAEDVARDDSVDAVLISTPNDAHLQYVLQFAKAHKHIICEKPVALSSSEFALMIDAGVKGGVKFTAHQNRRWDEDFRTAEKIANGGKIGKLCRIESNVCASNGIPGGWRKIPSHGGGMMLDWGVHLIDQMYNMFGAYPTSVYCEYDYIFGFEVDDGFRAEFKFGDVGASVRVDTNTYVHVPRWMIYGRDGTAVIEDWDITGKIVTPNYNSEAELVGIEAGNGFTKTMAYRGHSSEHVFEIEKVITDHDAFYNNFADAVEKGEKLSVDTASVMTVLKIMEYCKKSALENRVISGNELVF